jgi:glycosyltransferase involved in cell wall biosynthesis
MVAQIPAIPRNDWAQVAVPELGQWRPTRTVSVVIPAYNCQPSLDLVLAALTEQTYPADLVEVVVVDDGSQPPLRLPEIRPANCRVIRPPADPAHWGTASASDFGIRQSSGEIIQRLDADMVVYPNHLEAHARWHHLVPYAVTLGAKRFIDVYPGSADWPDPARVARAAASRHPEELFDLAASEPHDYIEELIGRTGDLRDGDHLAFMAHVGATAALTREFYRAAGGLNPALRLGEDTEFGYRLAQAGALFVPEWQAQSWHLGRTHMMQDAPRLQRYNRPYLADLMPHPRWLRRVGGTGWAVPLVTVVVEVSGQPLELVRAAVDAILASDEPDLRVCLVGGWDRLTDGRRSILDDPALELRLVEATYRSDPRVRLVTQAPSSVFPSPYLLQAPVGCGLGRSAIGRLVEAADHHRAGLVTVALPGSGGELRLWRTSARSRARWISADPDRLAGLVARVHGGLTLAPDEVGVLNLSGVEPVKLATGIGAVPAGARRLRRWVPASVEVAGLRSWARATAMVIRLSGIRLRERGRRLLTGGRRPRR